MHIWKATFLPSLKCFSLRYLAAFLHHLLPAPRWIKLHSHPTHPPWAYCGDSLSSPLTCLLTCSLVTHLSPAHMARVSDLWPHWQLGKHISNNSTNSSKQNEYHSSSLCRLTLDGSTNLHASHLSSNFPVIGSSWYLWNINLSNVAWIKSSNSPREKQDEDAAIT